MTRRLTTLLTTISDENTPLQPSHLGSLSDLDVDELAQFQQAWSGYSPARRLQLLQALFDLAEDNIEYDFRHIFRWTLADPDPRVRVIAIEGLWEDNSPHLIPVFQRLLHEDQDMEVRAAAATALGRFVRLGEIDELDATQAAAIADSLWEHYHNPSEHLNVRCRILESIAASSRPGVSRLIEHAFYDAERLVRLSALHAMGTSYDRRWIPYLIPELDNPDTEVRFEALCALGELEARDAVPRIIQLIAKEADTEVRLAALITLGQIGGKQAQRALEAASGWEDEVVASTAAGALEELLSNNGGTYDLIAEILGIDDEDLALDDDFYLDPLEEELRQLLEARDDQ